MALIDEPVAIQVNQLFPPSGGHISTGKPHPIHNQQGTLKKVPAVYDKFIVVDEIPSRLTLATSGRLLTNRAMAAETSSVGFFTWIWCRPLASSDGAVKEIASLPRNLLFMTAPSRSTWLHRESSCR